MNPSLQILIMNRGEGGKEGGEGEAGGTQTQIVM